MDFVRVDLCVFIGKFFIGLCWGGSDFGGWCCSWVLVLYWNWCRCCFVCGVGSVCWCFCWFSLWLGGFVFCWLGGSCWCLGYWLRYVGCVDCFCGCRCCGRWSCWYVWFVLVVGYRCLGLLVVVCVVWIMYSLLLVGNWWESCCLILVLFYVCVGCCLMGR